MPFTVNIQHLEQEGQAYQGSIPIDDLDLNSIDDLICPLSSLDYRLTVEKHETRRRAKMIVVKLFNVYEYRERPVCQGFPSHFEYPKAGLSGFSFPL